ncbi:hypothetical protein DBL05_00715 [Pseudomonas putida]|nr:hypothetical protein CW309_15120 [Pseudomonas hunanensis]PTV64934.1 hypothetical protein DBL05_00715 [Pseudomonas putida]
MPVPALSRVNPPYRGSHNPVGAGSPAKRPVQANDQPAANAGRIRPCWRPSSCMQRSRNRNMQS